MHTDDVASGHDFQLLDYGGLRGCDLESYRNAKSISKALEVKGSKIISRHARAAPRKNTQRVLSRN
jgi:hypothetical protein